MTALRIYTRGPKLLLVGRIRPANAVVLRFRPALSVEHGGQYRRLVTRIPKQTPQPEKEVA
jgi:hypothetical protein